MARFFNQMRKTGLNANNWSNYIKYAIGEISLVVLGILIALYINNWNEDRKTNKADKILLEQLYSENKINLQGLEEDVAYRDTLYATIYEFHEFLSNSDRIKRGDSLTNYLMALSRLTSYEGNSKYLAKYIDYHSNNQSMLTDELIRLDDRQRALKVISEKALELRFEKFFDVIANDIDFMTLDMESTTVLETLEFRNNLVLMAALEEGLYDAFNESLEQHKKIDSLINWALKGD